MNYKPTLKYEGVIRRIAVLLAHRDKARAMHHIKRILPHYDDMTDIEKEVVDELRLRIYC